MLTNEQVKDGLKVKWERRNGEEAKGIVRGLEMKTKGPFATVESVDDKGKPTGKFSKVRPSQLAKR